MTSVLPGFNCLSSINQFKTMLCPTVSAACKITNQFIRILFLARDKLSEGVNMDELTYPTRSVPEPSDTMDLLSDVEDEWDTYESDLDTSQDT